MNKKKLPLNYIIIFLLVVTIFLLFILFRKNDNKDDNIELILLGNEHIVLNYNEQYKDYGCKAYNNGVNDTKNVIITNNVDVTTPGIYVVKYQYKNLIKERTVEVLDESDNKLILELIGNSEIELEINSEYNDYGVIATYNDEDLSDQVKINNNLDITKVGDYEITYTLIYKNEKKVITRKIKVVDNNLNILIITDKINYTNDKVNLDVSVTGNNFKYLILPDQTISNNNKIEYEILENGVYTFKAYNTNNKEFEQTIEISNIDKIKPTGTCTATLNKTNTEIIVDAKDDISIAKYIYYDNQKIINEINDNTYTHSQKTSKKISVNIIDQATNETKIDCKIIDKSYDLPIIPTDKVETKIETDTFKAYISKISNYYLTRIWMLDPYTQANKFDSPEYGKKLYRPKDLLQKAMQQYNLKDKALIGFNASGFYLKNKYDPSSVKRYSGYDKTSVGTLVITNGKVVRNAYQYGDLVTWFITGITEDNKMRVFEDTKVPKKFDQEAKKKWSESVINSGIRNTYTFAAPVILDGKKTNYSNNNSRMPGSNSTNKGLQMLCQINDNNFVLFTSKSSTRNKAIAKFLELGCITAVNLDGGGSIALLYKEKNSTEIKVKVGNERSLPEAGYFVEQ